MRFVVSPEAPSPAGPYSHAVVVGGFVYTAGFGPQHPETGAVADDVVEQTRQVLENLQMALHAVGSDLGQVVKTTCHLRHPERDFAEFNVAYREFFDEPYPVRTTVGSELPGILVEIDAVAVSADTAETA
ncbi:RidA family protein [Ruania alba]|uniref:2-iminobutanoate/2-iminopropanoate deaminase n=1 Tax=Ruania alba TaxID=648782 RepID=A0A1H5KLA3_9MICO|nr:Rid family hydrolase [Ruania alba]SEE65555.1 2-iminobutanoate/2-iminopropanoate deaminase [Ruania alba]